MSSWRKLMTPIYDKYFQNSNDSSILSHSRFSKNISMRSTGQDSANSSFCNEKLQKLQSEMSRLKSELNKLPTTSRHAKGSSTSRAHRLLVNDSIAEHSPVIKEEESPLPTNRSKKDGSSRNKAESRYVENISAYDFTHNPETPKKKSSPRMNAKGSGKNLMTEYDDYQNQTLSPMKNEISQINENDRKMNKISLLLVSIVDHIHEKGTLLKSSVEMSPSTTYYDAKRIPTNTVKLKENLKTEKPKRRTEKVEKENKKKEDGELLKKALIGCQEEISELKEIVLHSKSKIDHLQEELENEKKKSLKMRSDIRKNSNLRLTRNKVQESNELSQINLTTNISNNNISNNNISALCDSPILVKHKTPVSSTKKSRKHGSYDMRESEKLPRMFHSGDKSRDITLDDQSRLPGSDIFKSFKQNALLKKNQRDRPGHASFGSRRDVDSISPDNNKTAAVQCDFMLEKIADTEEDELLEKRKEEISKLKDQIGGLKSNKNQMIETFQEIIQLLANKTTANTIKSDEIKSDFQGFYEEFNSRVEEISRNNLIDTIPKRNEKENLTIETNTTTLFNKAKQLRIDVSDNFIYSPSNVGTSFLENLIESKMNALNPTMTVETPFMRGAQSATQTMKAYLSPKF